MQPEDELSSDDTSACGEVAFLGGAADSANRPWETDWPRSRAGNRSTALGWLAICAAALLSLADLALLYSPAGSSELGGYLLLAGAPRWRLLLGHYLAALLLPAYIPGYWLVLEALRDAGAWRSWPVFLLGSYAAAVAGAVHGLIALLALIVQHRGADPLAAQRLLAEARAFVDPLRGLVICLLALTSLWFAAAVLSGRSRLPRWLAAANPLLLALLFVIPHLVTAPSGPALLAAPLSFNLAHLVFFSLLTIALRRRSPA